jgi:hypothetical protein
MKLFNSQRCRVSLVLFCAGLFAGCGGAQSIVAPGLSGPTAFHVQPQTSISTIVGIRNNWIATISGAGSAQCWSISPGLPNVGGFGQLSGPVTLAYTPLCPSPGGLQVTYGPEGTSTSADCTFNISYTGSIFTYSFMQGSGTKCSVGPSPTTGYDEILTYAQIGPDAKRLKR